jgi:hypothetical protein
VELTLDGNLGRLLSPKPELTLKEKARTNSPTCR